MRARIVLRTAEGALNGRMPEELGITAQAVGKWRARLVRYRIDGLTDAPRPNVHRKLTDDRGEEIIRTTLQSTPAGARSVRNGQGHIRQRAHPNCRAMRRHSQETSGFGFRAQTAAAGKPRGLGPRKASAEPRARLDCPVCRRRCRSAPTRKAGRSD